jgi:thioredoxin reductase (NADPH)
MNPEEEKTQCLIIGSGPAGYTAAIYISRAGLKPLLFQGLQPGGQLTITTDVENFPGYPDGVGGTQMMTDLENQAKRFGADIRYGVVTSVDFSKRPFTAVVDDSKRILADSVIIATGASAKWLGIPSEQKFSGSGVSACATCDGFFYKGQDVAVAGGGDTAAEEATYLANLCRKVYLIVRRDELRACKTLQKRIADTKNIEILWNHIPKEITGNNAVEGVTLTNTKTGEEKKIKITGFFVAIGHHPNSEIFKDWINLDENGYIKTVPGSTATNIKGVFAAGDVQDHKYRQAVTAAGTGCMAALEAEQYLLTYSLGIEE